MSKPYRYRSAFGVWINDTRNTPVIEEWPSALLDDECEDGLYKCFDLAQRAGYNTFNIFGLFATYAWKPDIPATVPDERMIRVRRVISEAHRRGLKLILGIGVYSWGFDEIIATVKEVQGTNPHAMCLSSETSWVWMRRILDYVVDNFDFDGYHLESSDQRRCECDKCKKYTDVEYFSKINAMCADYIRAKEPGRILMVNMSMYLMPTDYIKSESDFQALVEMSASLDYLIDGGNMGFFIRGEFRERAFTDFKCAFGSGGEYWVYMPQRWDKLRWFLPTLEHSCTHLKEMAQKGGDAVEFYMGATINPGVEMTILCGGKILFDPGREVYDVLCEAVVELYKPDSNEVCERLADIFLGAERAYYQNVNQDLLASDPLCNELILEPLFGTEAGPPIYLSEGKYGVRDRWMSGEGRAAYRAELEKIRAALGELRGHVTDDGRVERIMTCIENAIRDIDSCG